MRSIRPVSLLILAIAMFASVQVRAVADDPPRQLLKTYSYDFNSDLDLDRQPDYWTRTVDRAHPHYISAQIDFTTAHSGEGSLKISSEGASAEFLSPPVQVEDLSAYDVTGHIKAESLVSEGFRKSRAYIEARLYDRSGALLASKRSFPDVTGTCDWTAVSAADVAREVPEAKTLRVAVVLEGLSLVGSAWFDDIEIRKRPIAFFHTNRAANCWYSSDRKIVFFDAQGLPAGPYVLNLRVDESGGEKIHETDLATQAGDDGQVALSYNLPLNAPGAYVITLALSNDSAAVLEQTVRMGIVPDRQAGDTGKNFGISLEEVPAPDSPPYDLTVLSGVGWVKIPLAELDTGSKTQYLRVLNEFRRQGISPVGVITLADASVRGAYDVEAVAQADPLLGLLLKGPDAWVPLFGDTINTFAGSVHWWQVGDDKETSLADAAGATPAFEAIEKFINSVSYQGRLGIPARALSSDVVPGGKATRFISMQSSDVLAPGDTAMDTHGKELWAWDYASSYAAGDPSTAAGHLYSDVAALFAAGARTVFLRDPWKSPGILDGEGNVTPFALAMATLMRELSNYTYAGSISLPDNTPNAIFSSPDNTKVVLWPGPAATEERIFLGQLVDIVDIYGRHTSAVTESGESVVRVTTHPVILDRVEPAVVDTRKTFKIEPDVIDSKYETQRVYVSFTNEFQTSIAGGLTVKFPPGWEASPNFYFIRLDPGATFRGRFNITVPYNALSGKHDITATLQLGDLGSQKITIVDRKDFTSSAFRMEIETRSSGTGVLIYQKVTNISKRPADVSAFLEGQNLERVERLPRRIEPGASTTFSYTLSDASLWNGKQLRASVREVKTNRFLNEEFTVSTASAAK